MATGITPIGSQSHAGVAFLKELFGRVPQRDCAIRFWDGSVWEPEPGQPTRFTFVLKHPGAVRNMFWPPSVLSVAEAYIFDDFDVEGDMPAFYRFCNCLDDRAEALTLLTKLRYAWRLWRMPRVERARSGRKAAELSGTVHSRERDRKAISFHYDLSNEFFAPILGRQMVYTCGVFAHPDEDLDTAQERKNDLICKKLRIKPGERFLDIGCGWGGLVIHAAKHYGAKCLGVTLSERQAEWARRAVREAGLEDRCRIELIDYRDVDEREPFDKIATVEVTEHFGRAQLPTYFGKCWRLLRPQGSLLVQENTYSEAGKPRKAVRAFGRAYIFPDFEFGSVSCMQGAAETAGFEVRDVEAFREHYGFTLTRWLHNLEAHHDELVRATDEATYRTFRLYFAGCSCLGMFDSRHGVYQTLFVKAHPYLSGYPLSRAGWYANERPA